jgi:hypothetical protein
MGSVTFNATESRLPHHVYGDLVTLDIDFQEALRGRKVEKSVKRAMGGAMEVIKHRSDVIWDLTFEPVSGRRLLELREFLDSTEAGEAFTIDAYGTSSAPKSVKRLDEGYDEEPFMRTGSEDGDMFVVRIQVVEL